MKMFFCGILGLGVGVLMGAEEVRVWTSADGRTIQAVFREVKSETVVVDVVNGAKGVEIPLARLSAADQDFVKQAGEVKGGEVVPSAAPVAGEVSTGILAGYNPASVNFVEPWPKRTGDSEETEIKVISEDKEKKHFEYESPHFRFETDFAMRPSLLSKIAQNFEACYALHKALPLNNRRTRATKAGKFKAKIFEEKSDYMKNGGMANTSGVYMGGPDHFMTYAEALGLRKSGSSYAFDMRNSDFHVVYHEIVHLLWADISGCAGTWMSEGMAEFFACAGYSNGVFDYSRVDSLALAYALDYGKRGTGGRGLGKEIVMPHLKKFMEMSQEEFYATDANKNYGLGLLLVYYFVLEDGKADGQLFKDCVKKLQDGGSDEDGRKVLLAGRSYEQLEKDFVAGMRRKGVKIEFR